MTFNVTSTGTAPITSTSSSSHGSCGNNTGSMPSCGSDPKGSSSAWGNIAEQQCGGIGGSKGGSGGSKAGSGKKGGSGGKAGSGKKGGSGGKAGSGKKGGSGGSKSGSGKKSKSSCGW